MDTSFIYYWSTLSSLDQNDLDRLERAQRRAIKKIKGLENLPFNQRLKGLVPSFLEKSSRYSSSLKGCCKERVEAFVFTRCRAMGTSCTGKGFILMLKKYFFFTVRTVVLL